MPEICQTSSDASKSLCNGNYYGFYITSSDFSGETITKISFNLKGSGAYNLTAYSYDTGTSTLTQFGSTQGMSLTSSYQKFEFSGEHEVTSDTYFVFFNGPDGDYMCNSGNNEFEVWEGAAPSETRLRFVYQNYTTSSWDEVSSVYPTVCITTKGSDSLLNPPQVAYI